MFRTKKRIILVVAAFAIVVGVILFLALSGRQTTAIATNGRKTTIEKITFGTHHRFTQGKWWVRLLKPIRGARWAALRGCYETRFTNDVPALMVWTRWEGATASNGIPVEATVLDENGTESELVLNQWNAVPPFSPSGVLENAHVAWLFRNFPRRSKTIRLRIYDRDRRYLPAQAVEIAFSNPARKRSAPWQGSELPLAIKTNDTEFVLRTVQQISNALWRLEFLVRTNGVIDPSWLVGGITAFSSSGNVLSTRSNLAARPTTDLTFHLRGALWPNEPVWRLTTEFVPVVDLRRGDTWALTNVAIPARNTPLRFTTNLPALSPGALTFEFQTLARTVPYKPRGIRRNANIAVQFDAGDRHLLLLAGTDDQGRRIESEVDPGAPRSVYAFGLAIPDGAQAVNLTFAVRKPLAIDFHVRSESLSRRD